METDEPPDSKIEVFVSDNGEHDYVKINGHELTPFQIKERLELYKQGPRPLDLFSYNQYSLYHDALEALIKQRLEKGHRIKIPRPFLKKQ